MLRLILAAAALGLAASPLAAQRVPESPVTVDRSGVLRWTTTGREVALFGVNYATPFAYDYRAVARLGQDPKRVIDQDVAHFARLGLDAFRIHVWDKEVSDREGNLLANVHLDLLDYLLAQLSARGIKTILTPIAWWGPGYPEPDPPSPGFANGYSKPQMAVDTVVRKAQARYVAQFVAHVNPYRGFSYRDDPDIIAFEIFNEPWHDLSPPDETTRYINALVASMRGTGLRKPIFYNISEHFTPAHGRAVCAANVQGVTGQWYPTGLVRGATLPGNPLPNVDRYTIPWDAFPECRNKARMVYEFDGADVAVPVMYPAMARAFRGAGYQWATQFAYDPIAIAQTNTEYQTHFLNLAYTPAKAISFLIAGEVFRRTPRGFDAGVYPASERFGAFRVSYRDSLSELVTDSAFVYTGDTRSAPPAAASLVRVAGVGSSAVVRYGGTGAYFIDRLDDGVWRLEVFPDAVPVMDPYSRGNLSREVTRIYWRTHSMTLSLPNLGGEFSVRALDAGNAFAATVQGATMQVRPGAYLLVRRGVDASAWTAERRHGARTLGEFFAPAPSTGEALVRHESPHAVVAGRSVPVRVTVAQGQEPDSVLLHVRYPGWQGYRRPARFNRVDAYTFDAQLWADSGRSGPMEYVVSVHTAGRTTTYPGADAGSPAAWDFVASSHWRTYAERDARTISLFEAGRDQRLVVGPGWMDGMRPRSELVAGPTPERAVLTLGVDAFGPTVGHVAFRTMLHASARQRLAADAPTGGARADLRVRLRAVTDSTMPVEFALVMADGTAWGTTIEATAAWRTVTIPVASLERVPLVLLPRPFPPFHPYDLMANVPDARIELAAVEGFQWGFRRPAGLGNDTARQIELAWVDVEPPRPR